MPCTKWPLKGEMQQRVFVLHSFIFKSFYSAAIEVDVQLKTSACRPGGNLK